MKFKLWLEFDSKDYDFYKNLLLGKLNLDSVHGLSQSIDTWQQEQLISTLEGLGEFVSLPQIVKDQVYGQIRSQRGTLEDLVRIMSSK